MRLLSRWRQREYASYANILTTGTQGETALNDERLLQACRRGDESAWEALVERYQRLIYAIPRRAGLDKDQAAEVFQEVFTTLTGSSAQKAHSTPLLCFLPGGST